MNWKDKSVLVTGAAGFIGSNLTRKLHDMGARVYALDNLSSGMFENLEGKCEKKMRFELSSRTEKWDMLPEVEYVFHAGAPSSIRLFTGDLDNQMITWALNGFYNMLRYCQETWVKKLVWASSATYYGNQEGLLTEDKPPKPANVYGFTKVASEVLMNLFPDINHVGLRIFPAFGPYEEHKKHYAGVPYLFIKDMMQGKQPVIWGNGSQERDFIYIDDLVDLIIKAAERDTSPYLNIGTGIGQSYNKVVNDINEVLGTKIEPIYVPNPYEATYLKKLVADVTKMKRELGMPQVSFEDGLRRTAEWIRRNILL